MGNGIILFCGCRHERFWQIEDENYYLYRAVHFGNESQADTGSLAFVIAGSFPKFLACFRQELVIHVNSAMARWKTSLAGTP